MVARIEIGLSKKGVDEGIGRTKQAIKATKAEIDSLNNAMTRLNRIRQSEAASIKRRRLFEKEANAEGIRGIKASAKAIRGRNARIIEGARAADDFATVLQGGAGFGAALRGAANNLTQIGASLGPLGAVVSVIGVTLGTVILPRIAEAVSKTTAWKNFTKDLGSAWEATGGAIGDAVFLTKEYEEALAAVNRSNEEAAERESQFTDALKAESEVRRDMESERRAGQLDNVKGLAEIETGIEDQLAAMRKLSMERRFDGDARTDSEEELRLLIERRGEILSEMADRQREFDDQVTSASRLRNAAEQDFRKFVDDRQNQEITNQREINRLIEEQVELSTRLAGGGNLSPERQKDIAREINQLGQRRVEIEREREQEKVREQKDAERRQKENDREEKKNAEELKRLRKDASQEVEDIEESIADIRGESDDDHLLSMGQVVKEMRVLKGLFDEVADGQRRLSKEQLDNLREQKSLLQQRANLLTAEAEKFLGGADDETKALLGGGGQSVKAIAEKVAQQRAIAASDEFSEEGPDVNPREVRQRRRAIEEARRKGFRDTVGGRATDDEVSRAQAANVQESIGVAQSTGQLSQGVAQMASEAAKLILEQRGVIDEQGEKLANVIKSLKSSRGQTRKNWRAQRGSIGTF